MGLGLKVSELRLLVCAAETYTRRDVGDTTESKAVSERR